MNPPKRRGLIALAVTASIVLSLVVVAQPTAAVKTTVSGPGEVQKPDTLTFESTVVIRDGERVPLQNYTTTLWSEGAPDETVSITFDSNGSVLEVSPSGGVIGDGEIRIDRLREAIEITPVERSGESGYGYGHGVDERTGERTEFGYGYGYGGPSTVSFEITLDSRVFKQGTYRIQSSVNTPEETGLFDSNVETFDVELPRGGQPPGRPGDGVDDRGVAERADGERGGDEDSGVGNEHSDDRAGADDGPSRVEVGPTLVTAVQPEPLSIDRTADSEFGAFESPAWRHPAESTDSLDVE